MAKCGVARIDGLFAGDAAAEPIGPGDPEQDAVGVVQDFLSGHGKRGLPGLLASDYGTFGPRTGRAVREFCSEHGLPSQDAVDAQTLREMVRAPAADPIASRGYLALALDFPYTGITKVLSLVALMEGQGRFAALNLNTDGAGLSFGIIQWAQKPGRLAEPLRAFRAAGPGEFARIFGDGTAQAADALIAHTQRANGGVDPGTGVTKDASYNLVEEPWVSRFKDAATLRLFQPVQVQLALAAFTAFHKGLRQFAPALTSERSVAFMIDLANQHGDHGAEDLYQAAVRPGMTERNLLEALGEASVRRVADKFKKGTRQRRESFLNTTLLSDEPFRADP